MKRFLSLALAASLVSGLPGGAFYEALAQTVPLSAPLPGAPSAGATAAGPAPVEATPDGWRDGSEQLVSFEELTAGQGLSAAVSRPDSERTVEGLDPASFQDLPRSLSAAPSPVGAARRGPLPLRSHAVEDPSEWRDAPAGGGFQSGPTLYGNLERFGAYEAAGRTSLHAASEEDASSLSEDEFRSLLSRGPGPTGLDAVRVDGGTYQIRITREFADAVKGERKAFRGPEWRRLYGDLAREASGQSRARPSKGDAMRAGVMKFRWMDKGTRVFFVRDEQAKALVLLDYKSKGQLFDYDGRGENAFYDELARRVRQLDVHLLSPGTEGALKAQLFKAADGHFGRRWLSAAPEPRQGEDAAAPGDRAPDPAAAGTSSGLSPPKVSMPLGVRLRHHLAYYGSFAAATAGFGFLVGGFGAAGAVGTGLLAALMTGELVRQSLAKLKGVGRGPKQFFTKPDLEAMLGDPRNAELKPAIERALAGLDKAARIAELLKKKAGAPAAPTVGWHRSEFVDAKGARIVIRYNLNSWGSPTAGFIGLAEDPLTGWMDRDWRLVGGAMAHEFGHIQMGDLTHFELLDATLQSLFTWTGALPAVRTLLRRKAEPGPAWASGWLAAGTVGPAVLAAAKAAHLLHASWAALTAFPAAWGLMLAAAALRQAYLRAQELRADQYSASLTHPSWMAAYLQELRRIGIGRKPAKAPGLRARLRAGGWAALKPSALYDAALDSIIEKFFRSHPYTDDRLRALGADPAAAPTAPAAAAPVLTPADEYFARLRQELEAARGRLWLQLGPAAQDVSASADAKGFVFAVRLKSGSLAVSQMPTSVGAIPVVDAAAAQGLESSEAYIERFRAKLERGRAELEDKLGPAAESIAAARSGAGFLLTVKLKDASAASKVPELFAGFPVRIL